MVRKVRCGCACIVNYICLCGVETTVTGGWVAGEAENKAISAFNWVEVEVEPELGKKKVWFLLGKEASQIEMLNIENTPTQHIIPLVVFEVYYKWLH